MSENFIRTYNERLRAREQQTLRNRRRVLRGLAGAGVTTFAAYLGLNIINNLFNRDPIPDDGRSTPASIAETNKLILGGPLKPNSLAEQVELDLANVRVREGKPVIDNAEDSDNPNIIPVERIVELDNVPVDPNKHKVRIRYATIVKGQGTSGSPYNESYLAIIVTVIDPVTGEDSKKGYINISENTASGVKVHGSILPLQENSGTGFTATYPDGRKITENSMNVVTVVPKPSEIPSQSP